MSEFPSRELAEVIARWRGDPELFVREAFPWGEEGTALASELGPDAWQIDLLRLVKNNLSLDHPVRVAISSGHGIGKALGHGEPVLTPFGWRAIESLCVGDEVIAGDGTVTKVIGVFPQGMRELFRVSLDDGCSVVVDGEHQWLTLTRSARKHGTYGAVRTTHEIAASLTFPNGNRTGLNHQIPTVDPIAHPEALLPIEPYVLGCWLGDGRRGRITKGEDLFEELEAIGASLGKPHVNSPRSITRTVLGISAGLRVLGLYGLGSHDRFIPPLYLFASIEQRTALLQGLLDTDGTIGTQGAITFDTSSEKLADDVAQLGRSLGGVVRRSGRQGRLAGKDYRWSYRVYLSLPREIAPFRLPRKANRYKPNWGDRNCDRTRQRFISGVEPVGAGLATCIAVAHPSQLYVTRDYIVTHNTCLSAWLILWSLATEVDTTAIVTATK